MDKMFSVWFGIYAAAVLSVVLAVAAVCLLADIIVKVVRKVGNLMTVLR